MNTLATIIIALTIVVSIETPEQIQAGWKAYNKSGIVKAWAEWDIDLLTNCIIHVPPLTQDTLNLWRHEIEHCRSGRWHN